jgi:hypothetical protein
MIPNGALAALRARPFPFNSRYASVGTTTLTRPDGSTVTYLKRRFVPSPERFDLLVEHTVADAERLDTIAADYLGDPEQFWRMADANNAMQPLDLVAKVGRTLRITLPEGIAGPSNA